VTVVIRSADTFEVLATNKLDDGLDASPAVIGDELYLRGNKSLYCIAGK
jgi:outer membrane protein assembly factor BamB